PSTCAPMTAGMIRSSVACGERYGRAHLCLQIAIHEVDLLQPAKALVDVLRADLADALDGLQFGVGGGQHLVEPADLAHGLRDHQLGESRDAPEDAVAPR